MTTFVPFDAAVGRRAARALALSAAVACALPASPGLASEADVAAPGAGLLIAPTAVVAADNPTASAVGVQVLQRGGNAVDAAVAVGLTLGVVNPFASGIGGGGFLLYREAATGDVYVLDFREVAPAAAHRDMFLGDDGAVRPGASTLGGLAVAVPGEAAGWEAMHTRFGRLPWRDVVEPARALAADGFEVEPLLERRIAASPQLAVFPDLRAELEVDGRAVAAGDTLRRPRLAWTLEQLAEHGAAGFYEGPVADDLVASVAAAGGILTHEDLAGYSPRWREPIASTYRGLTVFGMPTPSSGGAVVAGVLAVLDRFALGRAVYDDAIVAHVIAQAFAHFFADRARLFGDADFVDVPFDTLLSSDRTNAVVAAFNPAATLTVDDYGAPFDPPEDAGTSHFSIVDAEGNAVACTVTINTVFGSHVVSRLGGVVLNNEMDDFSASPGAANAFGLVGSEANAIAPGKRPLSSMSPTIVVDDAGVVGVLGGSGGPMIITETILGIVQMVDFARTAAEATASPRFHHQWRPFALVVEDTATAWTDTDTFGYEVTRRPFMSALQIVWRHADGWQAASDPRKLGAPAGY